MARRWVDRQTSRLVDHQDIAILIENRQWHFLRDKFRGRLWRWDVHQDGIADPDLAARLSQFSIYDNVPVLDQLLHKGTRQPFAGLAYV